jgi:hypothetical protein
VAEKGRKNESPIISDSARCSHRRLTYAQLTGKVGETAF